MISATIEYMVAISSMDYGCCKYIYYDCSKYFLLFLHLYCNYMYYDCKTNIYYVTEHSMINYIVVSTMVYTCCKYIKTWSPKIFIKSKPSSVRNVNIRFVFDPHF